MPIICDSGTFRLNSTFFLSRTSINLSKITEKAAALQIFDHVSCNQMVPEFQSAYRKNHSTETANGNCDILVNMNKQLVTLLVFLDLSAAFDTVDHDIILRRLEYKFGIKDQAVTLFKSYLSNRSQRIVIGSAKSDSFDLKFGVPQGSCLVPMLFSLYTSELFDVISQHLPTAHSYADDIGIYLSFNPNMILIKTPPLQQWKRASVTSVTG